LQQLSSATAAEIARIDRRYRRETDFRREPDARSRTAQNGLHAHTSFGIENGLPM